MSWDGDPGDGDEGWGFRGRGRYGGKRKQDDGHKIQNVRVIRATAAAILVQGEGLSVDPFGMVDPKQEEWIPISQLHSTNEVREIGDEGALVISTWLATKKGLL